MEIIVVKDQEEGIKLAKNKLYTLCTSSTLLFLSGGKTPRSLYEQLAIEEKLQVGSVALVDERYGLPLHETSNEKMISESGLSDYFNEQKIPYERILKQGLNRKETTERYENVLQGLFDTYFHSVALMGIGVDGHIASLPARKRFKIKDLRLKNRNLVMETDSFPLEPKERISVTFEALSKISFHIIIAFGNDKKEAIRKMFEKGSEDEIPARFYERPEISKKTLFITDQTI